MFEMLIASVVFVALASIANKVLLIPVRVKVGVRK